MISVIMPVYNCEKYLSESIESILNQTYRDFEFNILNDGSNDRTSEILHMYANKDDRINLIERENRGVVESLNELVGFSKGEYIARMDADDIALKSRLEEQLNYCNENPDVDILFSNIKVFGSYEQEQMKSIEETHNTPNFKKRDFFEGKLLCHPTAFIKKEVFEKIGLYNPEYKYCEDLELWMRGYRNGINIKKIDKVLLKYRKHPEAKTFNERNDYIVDIIRMRFEYKKDWLDEVENGFFIWGAGPTGEKILQMLKKTEYIGKLVGFIDSYKVDKEFLGYKIYKPEEAIKMRDKYIYTATPGGRKAINKYLTENGYTYMDDFMNLV